MLGHPNGCTLKHVRIITLKRDVRMSVSYVCSVNGDALSVSSGPKGRARMLQTIMSPEVQCDRTESLREIDGGEITGTRIWSVTEYLRVTEAQGEPFGRYFLILMTDQAGQDEANELLRLEGELGKPLKDCIIRRVRRNRPHKDFPDSQYFDLITIYGG